MHKGRREPYSRFLLTIDAVRASTLDGIVAALALENLILTPGLVAGDTVDHDSGAL